MFDVGGWSPMQLGGESNVKQNIEKITEGHTEPTESGQVSEHFALKAIAVASGYLKEIDLG